MGVVFHFAEFAGVALAVTERGVTAAGVDLGEHKLSKPQRIAVDDA